MSSRLTTEKRKELTERAVLAAGCEDWLELTPQEFGLLLDEIDEVNRARVSGAEASLGIAQVVRERNKEIADLIALLERCATALVWCAGAKAFGEEGESRKGWERVCLPVITDLLKTSPVIPLPGQK